MDKLVIATATAPAAIGPYSQAIKAGNLLFLSGQIPLNPATGNMVDGGIVEQTQRVLKNLQAVLEGAGGGLHSVVKTTVYMTDLGQFAGMNEVYAEFFAARAPARATVQVAALPKGALIEIDAIAVL